TMILHLFFQLFVSEVEHNLDFRGSRDRHNRNIQNIEENFRSEHNEDESIRKKGLTQHQINILPIEKFRSTTNKNDEENKCGVCWDEFELNQTLRRLTCLHLYHKQCIDPWLQRNNQCPICLLNIYRDKQFLLKFSSS
ncbi:unnamed protein product, partial [Rotaria sp. Silwood1]